MCLHRDVCTRGLWYFRSHVQELGHSLTLLVLLWERACSVPPLGGAERFGERVSGRRNLLLQR